jgi:uncharacterized protein
MGNPAWRRVIPIFAFPLKDVIIKTRGAKEKLSMKLTLSILPQKYAVCRLEPNGHIPHWALLGDDFISLTRTPNELSIICRQENVPQEAKADRGWRCARVEGPFDFSLAGVHVSLAIPLAEANISILAIATYETDHLLIQEKDLERAIRVLEQAGHRIHP